MSNFQTDQFRVQEAISDQSNRFRCRNHLEVHRSTMKYYIYSYLILTYIRKKHRNWRSPGIFRDMGPLSSKPWSDMLHVWHMKRDECIGTELGITRSPTTGQQNTSKGKQYEAIQESENQNKENKENKENSNGSV